MLPPSTLTPLPPKLNRAHLAFELAAGLTSGADILARYKLSRSHLKLLLKSDPQFRNQVREYKREWSSPKNAKERIRLKAQLAAEDGLIDLYGIFKDEDIGAQQRIEAYKQIVSLADVAPRKDLPEQGSRFSITINLGDSPDAPESLTITQMREETQDAVQDAPSSEVYARSGA